MRTIGIVKDKRISYEDHAKKYAIRYIIVATPDRNNLTINTTLNFFKNIKLKKGTLVSFNVDNTTNPDVRFLCEDNSNEIIRHCLNSHFKSLWLPTFFRRLDFLTEEEIVDFLLKKVEILSTQQFKRLLNYLPHEKISFWRNIFDLNTNISEVTMKKLILTRFHKIIHLITSFFEISYPRITWHFKNIYREINNEDQSLARMWMPDNLNHSAILAQMLSARSAEKVALKFYEDLGCSVEDISITQFKNEKCKDWTTHDLLVDNVPVDVKNARVPINKKNTYVEHCIPKFKFSRESKEVFIAAVLSPYLQLKYIEGTDIPNNWDVKPIRFLGELNFSYLESYENYSRTENIEFSLVQEKTKKLYPPWLFDYPSAFYGALENLIKEANLLKNSDMPSLENFSLFLFNPIPYYLALRLPLPINWLSSVSDWKKDFYNEILKLSNTRITLPYVFIAVLKHFLKMLKTSINSDYSPVEYKSILFTDTTLLERPLGIRDPLNIINELIQSLNTLWMKRENLHLHQFKSFRFSGSGILSGKRNDENMSTTILAYCGGDVLKREYDGSLKMLGKCGYSPLILGVNETCPLCRKLICERCYFCDINCENCKKRRNEFLQYIPEDTSVSYSNKKIFTNSYNKNINEDEPEHAGTEKNINIFRLNDANVEQ